jgi:hypothetical protein
MNVHRSIGFAACLLLALAAGCGSAVREEASGDARSAGRDEVSGNASCAFTVNYQGHTYMGSGVGVAPLEGKPLGQVTLPACDDTGEASGAEPAEEIELAEVDGVSPSVALVWRGHREMVLIREDIDYNQLPPALARLLRAPRCDPGDEPILLAGPWHGIIGADELDMAPPYDLTMYVEESSAKRYERAYLTVRVPAELRRPLSRADLRSSLWEGGTISLTVSCREGRYLAEQVDAHPPA